MFLIIKSMCYDVICHSLVSIYIISMFCFFCSDVCLSYFHVLFLTLQLHLRLNFPYNFLSLILLSFLHVTLLPKQLVGAFQSESSSSLITASIS